MKKIFFSLLILLCFSGCKKAIEKIKQDAVMSALTDGEWKITRFVNASQDITLQFADYKFKYHSNQTVDAIKNGTLEKTGTWGGNASNMTTWASFENVTEPILLINGTWNIIDNSWTYAELEQSSAAGKKTMRLEKQ